MIFASIVLRSIGIALYLAFECRAPIPVNYTRRFDYDGVKKFYHWKDMPIEYSTWKNFGFGYGSTVKKLVPEIEELESILNTYLRVWNKNWLKFWEDVTIHITSETDNNVPLNEEYRISLAFMFFACTKIDRQTMRKELLFCPKLCEDVITSGCESCKSVGNGVKVEEMQCTCSSDHTYWTPIELNCVNCDPKVTWNEEEFRCNEETYSTTIGGLSSWGAWGPWEKCTTSCGKGVQARKRKCELASFNDCKSQEDATELKDCYKSDDCGLNWMIIGIISIVTLVALAVLLVFCTILFGKSSIQNKVDTAEDIEQRKKLQNERDSRRSNKNAKKSTDVIGKQLAELLGVSSSVVDKIIKLTNGNKRLTILAIKASADGKSLKNIKELVEKEKIKMKFNMNIQEQENDNKDNKKKNNSKS